MQKLFATFFSIFFRKLTEFQPNFFSSIKKLPKLFLKFFSNFFFSKNFFYEFFSTNFFLVKIFFIVFFWRKFFFSQKYFCEIFFHIIFANFFCIWYLQNNVFCEIFYSKFCLLQIVCFAILVYGKKNVNFFCDFFFQQWTWIPNLKMFLFWKKVKFSLIVLSDFFTHY